MVEHGIRPRLLLIEFTPPLFHDPRLRMASEENWTTPEWISGRQLGRMIPYFARRLRAGRAWLESRVAPWYTYRWFLTDQLASLDGSPSHLALDPCPRDRWGWRHAEPITAAARAQCWRATRQYIPVLERFRFGTGAAQALRDLLAYCRRQGIPAALVLSPESLSLRSWYSPHSRRQIQDFLAEMQADYGVAVIDGTCWLDNDNDYLDGNHLDVSGATQFTTRLIAEVQRLLP